MKPPASRQAPLHVPGAGQNVIVHAWSGMAPGSSWTQPPYFGNSINTPWGVDLYALAQTELYQEILEMLFLRRSTMPLPPLVEEPVVWHYTDGAGLAGIVQGQRLWASSPTTLNDSEEIGLGLRLLRERVDQTRKGLTPAEVERLDDVLAPDAIEAAVPRLFIVSASLEGAY